MAIPKVAVVVDGGDPVGRAIALALAARGAAVVVAGCDERALAETVGEIAFGGGRARHVVGDARAAASRALEVFGAEPIVVRAEPDEIAQRVVASFLGGASGS